MGRPTNAPSSVSRLAAATFPHRGKAIVFLAYAEKQCNSMPLFTSATLSSRQVKAGRQSRPRCLPPVGEGAEGNEADEGALADLPFYPQRGDRAFNQKAPWDQPSSGAAARKGLHDLKTSPRQVHRTPAFARRSFKTRPSTSAPAPLAASGSKNGSTHQPRLSVRPLPVTAMNHTVPRP